MLAAKFVNCATPVIEKFASAIPQLIALAERGTSL